jgi:hypothetical protein
MSINDIYGIDYSKPLYSQMYGVAPTKADQEQMIRDERLQRLEQAKLDKQARLGFNVTESLQQNLSNALDAQIYKEADGSLYQIDYMLDDQGMSQGTKKVPFIGKTRDLYIDSTAEGNMKLGLARTDQGGYTGRYDTLLHPEWETASNNQLAGPKGVTPKDGALMNITLPYNYATQFEYGVHSDVDQIRNRAMGVGPKSGTSQAEYGSGQTEYTTQDAPMWNADYIRGATGSDVGVNTPMPETPKFTSSPDVPYTSAVYTPSEGLQIPEALGAGAGTLLGKGAELLGEGMELGGSIMEMPGKAVESFGEWQEKYNLKHPPKTGDKVSETISKWQSAFAAGAKDLGKWMNTDNVLADTFREEGAQIQQEQKDFRDKSQWNDLTGYDPKDVQRYGEEFADRVEKGNYGDAIGGLFDTRAITAFSNSLPEMVAMANPWGLGTVMASNVNKNLNDLYANADKKGEVVTKGQVAASTGLSIVSTYLDRLGDKAVLSGNTVTLAKIIDKMPASVTNKVMSVYEVPLKGIGISMSATGKVAVEGITEGAQEILEGKAQDSNLQNLTLTAEEKRKALEATGIGLGAGGIPVAGRQVLDSAKLLDSTISLMAAGIKGITNSESEAISEEPVKLTEAQVKSAETVDKLKKFVDTDEPKGYVAVLKKLDLLDMGEDTEIEAQKLRQTIADKLSQTDVPIRLEELRLGSSEEAEAFIEEMFVNATDRDSTSLMDNLLKVGEKFDIGSETVKLIKDSATVEFEATAGKKGYETYDRALKRLSADPEGNSKTISQIEDQLEHFENTQIDRLDRFEKKVSTIEANLKSGIQKNGKERVSYAGGGGFDIYVKDGKIIPATYDTIKAIKRNVEGIGKVIDKYGIQRAESTVVDPYSPIGKFRVDKKVTPKNRLGFLSKLESKIKKGETIFMDIASKRTKTEHITANKLAKNGYVEVDVVGHPQPKSGRWVSKINIKVDETKVEAKRQKLEKKTESMEVTKVVTRLQRKELLTLEEEAFKAEHEAQIKQELQQVDVIAKIQQIDNNIDVYTEELKELEKDAESNGTEILKLSNRVEELEAQKEKIISKDITRDLLGNSVSNIVKEAGKGYAGAKFAQPTEISKYVKLSNSVSSLLGSVHVKYFNSAVVQDARLLTTKLLKKILAPIDNEVTKYKVPKELLQLMSSPSRGLIFDTEGSINENVAVAIDVALTEYMAMGAYNLGSKNKEQIAAMTGKQEFDVDKDMIKFFKDLGMYSKNAVDDIGKTVLRSLGLSMNENIPQDLYAKLVADLGNVALHVGIENGDLEFIDVKAAKHNKFLGYIIDEKTVETTIPFIRFTAKGKADMPIHKAMFAEFKKAFKVEDTFRKGPHSKPIKTKDRSIRNNPITEQSDTAAKVMDLFRQDRFVKEEGVFTWLVDDKNRDIALHHLGYMTEKEMQELSYNARDSQEAKNEEIVRSLDALKELEMDEMYFDWFYSKNGRYMMDSNTVNPQTDKLHRFTIVMEAHKSELDVNNVEHMGLFRFALAQAFGMSTDKKSNIKVQEFGELLLKKDPKELMQMLETGKFTDGIEVEHLGHYLQGVEALKVYSAAKDGKFDTFLTVESDAVTSGFGLKLLQFPILKDKDGIKSVFETVKGWLAKTGMFVDKTVTSMNDEISAIDVVTGKKMFFDSYETLAKAVHHGEVKEENYPKKEGKDWNPWDGVVKYDSSIPHEIFVAVLPTVDGEGEVGKALRTLFKDPFMTFNYSRGIGAIKKSLGSIIADGLIDKFVAGKDLSKEESALLLKLKLTYGKSLISDLKKKDPSTITAISPGMPDLYKYLNDMGVSTYGHLAAKSLEDNFSEFVKVNDITNKAFTEMFMAYETDYLTVVNEMQNSKSRGITKKEDLEIIKSLRGKFPLIKGPYSKAKDLSDTIAIYDTVNVDSKTLEESYGTVSTKLAGGKDKKVQSKIRQLKAAIKSGSVVPIHYLDGAAIGNTTLNFNGGILGIHDAIIANLLKTKEVVSNYNKNIVEVNKEYSIIEALLESYARVFKDASTKESEKTLTELKEVTELITKMRKELFSHDIDVVHMSAMPGSKYAHKGENTKVESTYNDAQKKAILEILNKPVIKQLLLRNNIQLEEC